MAADEASDEARPRVIRIPTPAVVVLVGPAGAGKSTLARREFAAGEILSSDELRAAVRGDAADQTATRLAFKILHRELRRRLFAGRTVVVDATNLTRAGRAAVLRLAGLTRVRAVAVVLVPPAADIRARNAGRATGIVPAAVVDRQIAAALALGADERGVAARLRAEGFAAVHVLTTTRAVDSVVIERVSR
jgi:protein phosphatase